MKSTEILPIDFDFVQFNLCRNNFVIFVCIRMSSKLNSIWMMSRFAWNESPSRTKWMWTKEMLCSCRFVAREFEWFFSCWPVLATKWYFSLKVLIKTVKINLTFFPKRQSISILFGRLYFFIFFPVFFHLSSSLTLFCTWWWLWILFFHANIGSAYKNMTRWNQASLNFSCHRMSLVLSL